MAQWYYSDAGVQLGPIPEAELVRMLRQGQVHDETLVWQAGMSVWEPLARHRAALGVGLSQNPFAPPQSLLYETSLPGVITGHPVVHAGFLRRWLAIMIDSLVLGVPVAAIAIAMGFLLMRLAGTGDQIMENLFSVLWLLAAPFYYAGCESSAAQATLGKRALGIKVVDLTGQRLTFIHALGRWFAATLSYLTLYIGFFLAGFTQRKQALHDFVAQTLVVDRWAYTDSPEKQQSKLSGCAIAALLVVVPGIILIPILAAIAIPAYHAYSVRAQAAEVLTAAYPGKAAVAEFVMTQSRCPTDWSELPDTARPVSPLISESLVGEFDGNGCGIQVTLAPDAPAELAGNNMYWFLDAEAMTWTCTSDIQPRYLPGSCR